MPGWPSLTRDSRFAGFNMARRHAGQVLRRDTREHVGLYVTAFNAWAAGQPLGQLHQMIAALAAADSDGPPKSRLPMSGTASPPTYRAIGVTRRPLLNCVCRVSSL